MHSADLVFSIMDSYILAVAKTGDDCPPMLGLAYKMDDGRERMKLGWGTCATSVSSDKEGTETE